MSKVLGYLVCGPRGHCAHNHPTVDLAIKCWENGFLTLAASINPIIAEDSTGYDVGEAVWWAYKWPTEEVRALYLKDAKDNLELAIKRHREDLRELKAYREATAAMERRGYIVWPDGSWRTKSGDHAGQQWKLERAKAGCKS